MEKTLEKTDISADITALTSASDLSWAVTGVGVISCILHFLSFFYWNFLLVGIVAGLLVVSYLLYMVDVWATDRIDGLLLAHYGPELYERYTTALHEVRSNIYFDQNLRFTI